MLWWGTLVAGLLQVVSVLYFAILFGLVVGIACGLFNGVVCGAGKNTAVYYDDGDR